MSPVETAGEPDVSVEIDELVLEGSDLDPAERDQLNEQIEAELRRLLQRRGTPSSELKVTRSIDYQEDETSSSIGGASIAERIARRIVELLGGDEGSVDVPD